MRLRPAPAAAGHLAVGATELRRPRVTDQASVLRFIEDNWDLGPDRQSVHGRDRGLADRMFDFNEDHSRAPSSSSIRHGQPVGAPRRILSDWLTGRRRDESLGPSQSHGAPTRSCGIMSACRRTPSSGSITRKRASFTSTRRRPTKRRSLRRNIICTGIRKGVGEAREHPDDAHRFFGEVARALDGVDAILIVGPSSAKLEFFRYVHEHDRPLESKVVGIEIRGSSHRRRDRRPREELLQSERPNGLERFRQVHASRVLSPDRERSA